MSQPINLTANSRNYRQRLKDAGMVWVRKPVPAHLRDDVIRAIEDVLAKYAAVADKPETR